MRRLSRLWVTVAALTLAVTLVTPAAAQTTHPTGNFILTNGTAAFPNAVDSAWTTGLTTLFTAMEIQVRGSRVDASEELPVTHATATGTESISLNGTYNPSTGTLDAGFTFTQHLDFTSGIAKTWDITWNGSVAGTVNAQDAPLTFSGTLALRCTYTIDEPCNGGDPSTLALPVTFAVTATTVTTIPNTKARVLVTGASGPVYWSNAAEADVEPAQRTWTTLEPGKRVALPEQVTIRTGRGGTVKLTTGHDTVRLGQSTMFTVYLEGSRFSGPPPSWSEQWADFVEVGGVLAKGIAEFYRPHQEMSVGPVEPGSKLFEYYYDKNGRVRAHPERDAATRFVMKAAANGATTVVAKKSTVLVEHVTGTSVTLRPGQSVTSTSEGLGPIRK